jgi:hypothetical protein
MGVVPLRSNMDDGRRERLEAQLDDIEQRLQALQRQEERVRGLEQTLLDASAARVHDFERRLEHEWVALRQLYEDALKKLEQRTNEREASALLPGEPAGTSPSSSGRGSRAATIATLTALALLTAFTVHTRWRLGADVSNADARAAAAEARVTELQTLVGRQTREMQQTVQRLSADALTSAVRAERLANLVAAPDVRVYPMRGYLANAAASGQILFSHTRGIALTGAGLTLTPANQVYQVWMTTTRGPISLGFASPDGQGRVGGSYEAPPELAGTVIGFMLTLEPTGGSAKPAGPMALGT